MRLVATDGDEYLKGCEAARDKQSGNEPTEAGSSTNRQGHGAFIVTRRRSTVRMMAR